MSVAVVLSTWNGEAFVAEQLHSVLQQLPPDGVVLVRDDGSSDRTVECIRAIADVRVYITEGENVGYVSSFFELLDSVPTNYDVVMLCDQDDVWLPGKITRAVEALAQHRGSPALYCSAFRVVDQALVPLGESPRWPRGPSFASALAENIVTGCTAALNREGLEVIRQRADMSRIAFHDWWLYVVIAACGRVMFDVHPTVLYRQHTANVIGMGTGWQRYVAMWRIVRTRNWVRMMFDQAQNLLAAHAHRLTPTQQAFVEHFFCPGSAVNVSRIVLARHRWRQTWLHEALFRVLVLATWIVRRDLVTRRP